MRWGEILPSLAYGGGVSILKELLDTATMPIRLNMQAKKQGEALATSELIKGFPQMSPEEQASVAPVIKSRTGFDVPTVTDEATGQQRYVLGQPTMQELIASKVKPIISSMPPEKVMAWQMRDPQLELARERLEEWKQQGRERLSQGQERLDFQKIMGESLVGQRSFNQQLALMMAGMKQQQLDINRQNLQNHIAQTQNTELDRATKDLDNLTNRIGQFQKSDELRSAVPGMIEEFNNKRVRYAERFPNVSHWLPELPFEFEQEKPGALRSMGFGIGPFIPNPKEGKLVPRKSHVSPKTTNYENPNVRSLNELYGTRPGS